MGLLNFNNYGVINFLIMGLLFFIRNLTKLWGYYLYNYGVIIFYKEILINYGVIIFIIMGLLYFNKINYNYGVIYFFNYGVIIFLCKKFSL